MPKLNTQLDAVAGDSPVSEQRYRATGLRLLGAVASMAVLSACGGNVWVEHRSALRMQGCQ